MSSGTPVFITKVGAGTPTQVTPEAAEGLIQLGWIAPAETLMLPERPQRGACDCLPHFGEGHRGWCATS